ncbi:hypothetical protein LH464_05350 [Neorhizobium sp. T786]|uniref:hypothetical protein n=1 Tax=Pseudorhizobium xiangyangii TaxID=2883104 RepID=UPI001CFFBD8D|nr:hypothetical protein [Neorhizobium xiangyangii]MCB5201904.1 hypothetical protein [Neorhizobium xiangyangii]
MTTALARTSGHSDLVETVERARALLDAGDVEKALKLSSVAYDQAKAAAGSAERVKASRELVEKARRMQADALKIETMCYVAMADAVDTAQAKGEISRGGRPKTVSDENSFTLDEVGVDRQQLHAARQLRNAVRAEPQFVERIVEARLSEGLEPSRAALKKAAGHAIGTKSRSAEERGNNAYFTPDEGTSTLLALESFSATVDEPACGRGHISKKLETAGYEVRIADLADYGTTTQHGEIQQVGDFLDTVASGGTSPDIVTNPPYGKHILNRFLAHALRVHRPHKMAALLNLNFMCGCEDLDRRFLMDECPPSRIYVFTRRLPMMHQDGWEGNEASSQMNTAWFVWERNEDGSYGGGFPQIIRVDWKDYQSVPPLTPGAGGNVAPMGFAPTKDEFERETPRKSVEERVDEECARALIWIAEQDSFDAGALRRGVGIRGLVADALITDFSTRGLIEASDDGWRISVAGMTALEATAAVVLAGKAVAA